MPTAVLGPVAGAVVGGLLSKKGSGNQQTGSTEKTPWAPAQPYLQQNLADTDTLRKYYQQNPFNDTQKHGYQGLLGNIDNFNSNVAPGLLQFANNGMASNYQRTARSAPGMAGSTQPNYMPQQNAQGPFSAGPVQKFGQVDWNASNPFYKVPGQTQQPTQQTVQEMIDAELKRRQQAEQFTMWQLSPGDTGGN